jgi:hypothetical protein
MNIKYIVGAVIGVVVLGVGYYALSPLFITIHANDAIPGADKPDPMSQHKPIGTNPVTTLPTDPSLSTSTLTVTTHTATPTAVVHDSIPTPVVGSAGHPASGTARIVHANDKVYIRYENFKTINGPDLYVYLANDPTAKDYIDLGKIKTTEGNVNYPVPTGTDIAKYPYVLIWCKTFGVLFNSAKLQ